MKCPWCPKEWCKSIPRSAFHINKIMSSITSFCWINYSQQGSDIFKKIRFWDSKCQLNSYNCETLTLTPSPPPPPTIIIYGCRLFFKKQDLGLFWRISHFFLAIHPKLPASLPEWMIAIFSIDTGDPWWMDCYSPVHTCSSPIAKSVNF